MSKVYFLYAKQIRSSAVGPRRRFKNWKKLLFSPGEKSEENEENAGNWEIGKIAAR